VGAALSSERAVQGRFGPYGGRYVPETLVAALEDLAAL
jgi:tryptophan synthase beta subunit